MSLTIERIYAAALDPSQWRDALTAVEDFTGSTGAVIDLIPMHASAAPRTLSGSFSDSDCARYSIDFQAICPRIAFAREHPEIPTQVDHLILSEAEMDRDPVYDWLGTHGLRYYIGGQAGQSGQYLSYFSLQRSRRQGHAQREDIALFNLVRPHLAQALALADSLDTLAAHRRFSDAMLDALPQAVFGLDPRGALLFVNAAAERLLARGDCLGSEEGRLVSRFAEDQRSLDALIADVAGGGCGGTSRAGRIGGGPPCAVRVSPIHGGSAEQLSHPMVLVVINDPVGAFSLDEEALHTLYGLTPAESRAAGTLLDGHSIQSAAKLLRVSPETMRSHLKAIFRKMGVSRQQDLVRMLAELEPLVASPPSPE